MKILSTIILSFLLFSCNNNGQADNENEKRQIDFKYLNEEQTYNFINSYYLPRLDTIETGRQIFIHPINKPDFSRWLKVDTTKVVILPPEPIKTDKSFRWDANSLRKVRLITEKDINDLNNNARSREEYTKLWRNKFSNGYVCISRPAFNAYSKRIIIREWIENNSTCGTDRERILFFKLNNDGKWQSN